MTAEKLNKQCFEPEEVLRLPLMANLATVCPEGPRNSPVWFIWEENAIWMPGAANGSPVQRLKNNPQCAVEIVSYDNERGILLHLGLRGCATIEAVSVSRFKRLLSKYLGSDEATWNTWFIDNIARIDDPNGRMIKLVPQSTFTNDVSFFRTGPDLATQ